MSALPPELDRLVEHLLDQAELTGGARGEVRDDLRQHLIDGLASGRSAEELAARFGDPDSVAPLLARARAPCSEVRPPRGERRFSSLASDARHGVRALSKTPSLAVTAITVLALGIGAITVVFTVLNELLLRPLPVTEPAGLVDIWADIEGGNSFLGVSWPDVETYRSENRVLEELAAFTAMSFELGNQGPAVRAQLTGPGYFRMLGLTPSVGSMTFPPDGRFGDEPVAVLSHAFWEEAFGADLDVIGRTIRLRDVPVTVIGVGPEGFSGHFIGFPTDLWLPVFAAPRLVVSFDPDDRTQQPFEMIGRLMPGVSAEAAERALNVIAADLELTYPDTNRGHRLGVTPTTGLDHSLQAGVTAFVLILTAISLLVLVVACLNVGSVLLVRAMSRERELAVRIALGAGHRRLVQLVLVESTLLALAGTATGLLVAGRLNDVLATTFRRAAPGLGLDLAIDWRVLALTGTAAVVGLGVAALAPTLHALGRSAAGVLRSRGGPAGGSVKLRSVLVIGQVSVSVVLVIATGLFVRALVEGGRAHYGFDVDRIATFPLGLPVDATHRHEQLERDVLGSLLAVSGVAAAAVGSTPPVGVARSPLPIDVPGVPPPPGTDRLVVDHRFVGPGYLETLGIPLVSGRGIAVEDDRTDVRVAVISDAFRRRYWPGEDPIGRSFVADGEAVAVIGVAADARYIVQDDTPDPLVYLSRAGMVSPTGLVVVRANDPLSHAQEIGAAVTELIPAHSTLRLRAARDVLHDALLPQRIAVYLVGAMGFAALFLSAVGLYGLIQFTVSRDAHELGVRLALGGRRMDLAAVVVRKGFRLVAIGTGIGVGVSLLTMPGLAAFLSGVSPKDPFTYGTVVACFALVAALASWLPARRALRIEASVALRGE